MAYPEINYGWVLIFHLTAQLSTYIPAGRPIGRYMIGVVVIYNIVLGIMHTCLLF